MVIEMFAKMMRIMFSTSFMWFWMLVFPASVGMQWNNAIANGLSQRGVPSKIHHQASSISSPSQSSSLLVKQHQHQLSGCETNLRINGEPLSYLATATALATDGGDIIQAALVETASEKPCGQHTYNQQEKYAKCGLTDSLALLPVFNSFEDHHTKVVTRKVTPRGSLDYIFDGGTAVRYPAKRLPKNWSSGYSISGWLFVRVHHERQYIVSWSDGDTMSRTNMGFYARRNHNSISFGFSHTHKEEGRSCLLRRKWKTHQRNTKWIFFTLTFSNCDVELILDGEVQAVHSPHAHLHAPERHLQPKFVIGARWIGSMVKYADFFNGLISGLVIVTTANKPVDQTIMKCIFQCSEYVSVAFESPSKSIESSGSLLDHQESRGLLEVNYTNTNLMPIRSNRQLKIILKDAPKTTSPLLPKQTMIIATKRIEGKLEIGGDCKQEELSSLSASNNHQIRICSSGGKGDGAGDGGGGKEDLIKASGCQVQIDSLTITLESSSFSPSSFGKEEKISIPPAYINRYRLSVATNFDHYLGKRLVVYGVANVGDYNHLLRQIRFTYGADALKGENDHLKRTFKVVATSYNGLLRSNTFRIHVDIRNDNAGRVAYSNTNNNNKHKHRGVIFSNNHYSTLEDNYIPSRLNKKVADSNGQYGGGGSGRGKLVTLLVAIIGTVLGVVLLLPAIAFMLAKSSSKISTTNQSTMTIATSTIQPPSSSISSGFPGDPQSSNNINENQHHNQQMAAVSTVYFVDGRGRNPTIRINPSARVSISNDPLKELLLKRSSMGSSSSLSNADEDDGSIYSDEESEFDNDSIRQLEWDCLEKDLTNVLNGVGDDRSSTCSRFDNNSTKDYDEAFYL